MKAGVAVVTGGSRGIGRAIVDRLLLDGWVVAFTYQNSADLSRQVVEQSNGRAAAFQFDLREREGAARLVVAVEREIGQIDGWVNNAGTRRESLLAMTSDAEWDTVVDANLGGVFRCCRAVVPKMLHRRRGSIVNIASLSAIRGVAGQSGYAASKAGIVALTRTLAREMGRRNIRVNAVLPGFVATDMTSDVPDKSVEILRSPECLSGGTTAVDVANLVAFLVSDQASAITGQAISVDGGASA